MAAAKTPATKPDGRLIDLDAARAARGESEPVTLRFMGQDWALPAELPFEFIERTSEGKIREAITVLLGDTALAFFGYGPTFDDIQAFAEAAQQAYGVTQGEAGASPGS